MSGGPAPAPARIGSSIDVDSFMGEVHGYQKQGAAFGYTRVRGYHPLVAVRAETRELLHLRLRKGSANTSEGFLRCADELIAARRPRRRHRDQARARRLGLWNVKLLERLERAGWLYAIGVRMTSRARGEQIPRPRGRGSPTTPPPARPRSPKQRSTGDLSSSGSRQPPPTSNAMEEVRAQG